MGKTRVAAAVAESWDTTTVRAVARDREASDPLLGQLADSLGLVQGDHRAVTQALARQDSLLVVDDVLPSDEDELAALLTAAPGLCLLTTARRVTQRGEARALTVPPLSLAAAQRLLVDRLPVTADPASPDAALLAELVVAMDRLPGVIELYARRALFGAEDLLVELREGGVPDVLERSTRQTLDDLSPVGRQALWRCAALGGPFEPQLVVPLLDRDATRLLLDRSLLHLDAEHRLFVPATLRRTIAAVVDEGERRSDVDAVHVHVLRLADEALDRVESMPAASLDALRRLRPHLLAVIDEGAPPAASEATRIVLGALAITGPASRLCDVLDRWTRRGHGPAEVAWEVIVALQAGTSMPRLEPLRTLDNPASTLLLGRALARTGETHAALRCFDAVAAAAPSDHWSHGKALVLAGSDARAALTADEARQRLDAACACTRQRFPLLSVQALVASAAEFSMTGAQERALPLLHEGLRIAAALPEAGGLTQHLWNGIGLAHARTDTRAALRAYQQAAAVAERTGSGSLPAIQLNIALSQLVLRRFAQAAAGPTEALRPFPLLWHMGHLARGAALHGLQRHDEAELVLLSVDWGTLGRGLTGDPGHGDALRTLVSALRHLHDDLPTARDEALAATAEARAHPLGLLARSLGDLLAG